MRKYVDTETFRFYNANPHNRSTGDCVIRAIAVATGIKYNDVLNGLVEISLKTGFMLNTPQCYGKYLANLGWTKMKQPRKSDNTKYTGEEFCKLIAEPDKSYIAHIGGHHAVAIENCKVVDIWNCTDGCIGNYWVKNN